MKVRGDQIQMLEIMLIQYMNCASQILEIVEWLESLKIFAIFWWIEFEKPT